MHPAQATKITYGWIRKGYKKPVKTKGSLTCLNILAALNLSDIGRTIINDCKITNECNIVIFLNKIRHYYPDDGRKIHIIVYGASYNHARMVKDWACVVNIELHFTANFNQIERL